MTRLTSGLILLFLMTLGGCSTTTPIVRTMTLTKTKTVFAPKNMIGRCQLPKVDKTGDNSDLLQLATLAFAEIKKCESDWQRLRDWREKNNAK